MDIRKYILQFYIDINIYLIIYKLLKDILSRIVTP